RMAKPVRSRCKSIHDVWPNVVFISSVSVKYDTQGWQEFLVCDRLNFGTHYFSCDLVHLLVISHAKASQTVANPVMLPYKKSMQRSKNGIFCCPVVSCNKCLYMMITIISHFGSVQINCTR